MFHIYESYLNNDVKKQIQKVEKKKPNVKYNDKVFEVYNYYIQNGRLKTSTY